MTRIIPINHPDRAHEVSVSDAADDARNDAGRRLVGALLSYVAGHASVDYTIRRYVPERVSLSWIMIAEDLIAELMRSPLLYPKGRRSAPAKLQNPKGRIDR